MRLHQQRDLLAQNISSALEEIVRMRGYLCSPKFTRYPCDNYINTWEVDQLCIRIMDMLQNENEEEVERFETAIDFSKQ